MEVINSLVLVIGYISILVGIIYIIFNYGKKVFNFIFDIPIALFMSLKDIDQEKVERYVERSKNYGVVRSLSYKIIKWRLKRKLKK